MSQRGPVSSYPVTEKPKSCPVSHFQGAGCAFAGFGNQRQYNVYESASTDQLLAEERKTLVDILLPMLPTKEKMNNLKTTDDLNPTDGELLALALGSPARRILTRAERLGRKTGWRDGHLSRYYGFCPPDPSSSATALARTQGTLPPSRTFPSFNMIDDRSGLDGFV